MGVIRTYTGKLFDPLKAQASDIEIEDIAHALSLMCRANGHIRHFYSVGQHSINCMKEAEKRGYSKRVQLGSLLHDASEAFLSDITRPVKEALPAYLDIEAPLQNLIWNKWLETPLAKTETDQIFEIDDAMLYHEFVNLADYRLWDKEPELVSTPDFFCRDYSLTEQEFLRLFHRLIGDKTEYFTVGIDWMSPCWIAVELTGKSLNMRCFQNIEQICSTYASADEILIDIPIGLPENAEQAKQRPDQPARDYLKGTRKSTVFNVPYRQIVYADSYEEAKELGLQRISRQSDGIRPMIRQVDEYLQEHPQWKNRLRESHPEVAFQALNHGIGLASKHKPEGIEERCQILEKNGLNIRSLLSQVSKKQQEDVLDAASLALTGQLGRQNKFKTLPEHPYCDSRGLKMQIVYLEDET